MAKATAKKASPFKTRKTKKVQSKDTETVHPPTEVAEAIDAFRDAQEKAKHYEGEMTVHKDRILDFTQTEFAKRALGGMSKSFKVMGDETMVTYVVQDSSAGLTDEEVEAIEDRWGKEAAEELVSRDFASIRFNAKVLEANYDAVVEALQTLPDEVVENLFKPMLMKASSGAIESAKRHTKSPEELRELLADLKMKAYIR